MNNSKRMLKMKDRIKQTQILMKIFQKVVFQKKMRALKTKKIVVKVIINN